MNKKLEKLRKLCSSVSSDNFIKVKIFNAFLKMMNLTLP